MRKFLSLIALVFITATAMGQYQWKVDPNHSSLNFNISHSGISMVNGKFLDYTGSLMTKGPGLQEAKVNFTVKVTSINTNVDARDQHLRTADFFEVDKYPNMIFKSTKILATGRPDTYLLYGQLTIKDVTRFVIFDVKYGGIIKNDKGEKMGVMAETTINRFDYNINYDPTAMGVGKDVKLIIHLQFERQ